MSKKLVAYFSASGVTARCAKALAQAADADILEIKPAVPYTKADLDWQSKESRSSKEMLSPSIRPALASVKANIADYDAIFLGFPIWWYVAPKIINSFLENYDFSNKTIIPFATSGSSGLGQTVHYLQPSASKTVLWKEGKLLNGNPSTKELREWVDGLNV